jgi:hypothetical protein
MRHFLKKIAIFTSIIIGMVLLVFAMPFDKKFAYHFIKGDCYGQGKYLWDRMAINTTPIDVAFIGSSRTIHAVWESKIEDILEKETKKRLNLANLGYCRLGENLPFILLKDLFKYQKPKICILEIRENPDQLSHPMSGYLADTKDIFSTEMFVNQRVFSDVLHAFTVRLEYIKSRLWVRNEKPEELQGFQYGYGADKSVADKTHLEDLRRKNAEKREKKPDLSFFAQKNLEKTLALAAEKGVKIVFLYLPSYQTPSGKLPSFLDFYQQHGEVWIPPADILENTDFWLDEGHFNDAGSSVLAKWLSGQLHSFQNQHNPIF